MLFHYITFAIVAVAQKMKKRMAEKLKVKQEGEESGLQSAIVVNLLHCAIQIAGQLQSSSE